MSATPIERQVEDESFGYGGYWKGTVADLIEGDGVRFHDLGGPCLLVEHAGQADNGQVTLLLTDRGVHIAQVIFTVLGAVTRRLGDDENPAVATLDYDTPVWIRL